MCAIQHIDISVDAPSIVLVFLSEELDAFVDFNVLLATDVRGLEFVV
jgi:hypothetical protein